MKGAKTGKIIEQYQTYLQVEKLMTTGTVAIYVNAAQMFIQYCNLNCSKIALPNLWNLQDLGKRELEMFFHHQIQKEQWQHSTVVTNLSGIRAFFDYLEDVKLIPKNIIKKYTLPRKLTELKNISVSAEQIQKLFVDHIPQNKQELQERLLLEFTYGLGMTLSSLVEMKVNQNSENDQIIEITLSDGDVRMCPFSKNSISMLQDYLNRIASLRTGTSIWVNSNGSNLSENQLQKILSNFLLKNDLPALSAQDLRDLSSLHFSEQGADMRSLQTHRGSKHIRRLQSLKNKDFNQLKDKFKNSHTRNDM